MSLKRSLMRRVLAGALMCGVAAAPAVAAPSCPSLSESEAQQAIKMHTELMVIGLSCLREGVSAFGHYQRFTNAHATAIRGYEATMIGYMKKNYPDNPTKRFDKLRTDLANELAQSVVKVSPETFCATTAARLEEMIGFGQPEFRAAALEAAKADASCTVTAANSSSPAKGELAEHQREGKKAKALR